MRENVEYHLLKGGAFEKVGTLCMRFWQCWIRQFSTIFYKKAISQQWTGLLS